MIPTTPPAERFIFSGYTAAEESDRFPDPDGAFNGVAAVEPWMAAV
jgi:hypothetical protein